jgi:hypothetical protein
MKQMSMSEMITYSTVLIKCEYDDGSCGTGTGFVIDLCDNEVTGQCIPVIITNKHVVQGSKKCIFEFCIQDSDGNPIDTQSFGVEYTDAPWVYHPDAEIDLCCLPIAPVLKQMPSTARAFYVPLETKLIPSPSQLAELTALEEVIMVGYPIGLSDTFNHKPIIRRGTTATHVKNNYQGKKDFLVDIACFPGSSGSPIMVLNEGSYVTRGGIAIGTRILLLGVLHSGPQYSSRGVWTFANLPTTPIPVHNVPMNLGVAVKANEILAFEKIFERRGDLT